MPPEDGEDVPDAPGLTVERPGVVVDVPGVTVERPGVVVEVPGLTVERPGVVVSMAGLPGAGVPASGGEVVGLGTL